MRRRVVAVCLLFGCTAGQVGSTPTTQPAGRNATGSEAGRNIWFRNTYGNEVLLTLIFPTLPGGFPLAVGNVLTSSRDTRFDVYGVINDPDCTAGDASTGFLDRCADPNATGIIGIRKFPNPNFPAAGPPFL